MPGGRREASEDDDGGRGRGIHDPWSQVEDIDGDLHYRVLGINQKATAEEIKRAYFTAARKAHPDKGGSAESFAAVQNAFDVLSDPKKRLVYDTWAKELEYRYVRGVTPKAEGGEDKLLDEFENLGIQCDPYTQLIVTCEVCRRPSNKECWTCGMKICDFCTLKRHWKGAIGLHWPLINSDSLRESLGKRQLEEKKKDDARRHALEDPNYRDEKELQIIRDFKTSAAKMLGRKDRLVHYDISLAQFYMWTQTDAFVYLACFIPTGYQDKEIVLEFDGHTMTLQPEDSPPLIQRALFHPIDTQRPVESFKTQDHRFMALAIPKATYGASWLQVFRGDSDGCRRMEPLYTLTELQDEVIMDLELPFWVEPDDVRVDIDSHKVEVNVRSSYNIKRTFWRDIIEEGRRTSYSVVDVSQCSWSLDDDATDGGERCKVLSVSFIKPPMSEEDITYKKGIRSDNRSREREGDMRKKGYRFFQDDEDVFALEDVLQAICFMQSGATYVPAKPWDNTSVSKMVREVNLLPETVQQAIEKMLDGLERSDS